MLPCFHVFGIAKLCPELKTTLFFSETNIYFNKNYLAFIYLNIAYLYVKKGANLIFSALPEI